MFARLNHLAIVSEKFLEMGKFYEAVFGLKSAGTPMPSRSAIVVGDGYVGLNVNCRRIGRPAGFDHFGVEVEDVETVYDRLRTRYPEVRWLQRPSNRPFAGVTTHDPDGNVFDLSQKDMENRKDIYVEGEWQQDRYIDHFAIRTPNAEKMAEFYADVLELTPLNREEGDDRHYLTDGRVTMVLIPWRITDYAGTGIIRPGPDHIGFKVESVAATMKDIEDIVSRAPFLTPTPVGMGAEGQARLKLAETCKLGHTHLNDVDHVQIDIHED